MVDIPVSKILLNRYNARRIKSDITDLKNSIEKIGVIQKITVRPIDDVKGYTHEVVCGDGRFRSLKELGRKVIDCEVRELTAKEAFILSNEENERRSDISPFEKSISYAIAVGIDQKIIKAALKKIDITTYERLDEPFTKTELGRKMGIKSASVDNVIEPVFWSDGLFYLHENSGLPKKLCREIRIHTKDGFEQECIGKKLVEIINSGNHIDKKDLNKFLKTIDDYSFDDLEKLLHMVFDKNQKRKTQIADKHFLGLCNTMCEAFNIHPEDAYEVEESISDAVSEEHEPDNEEVVVEEKKKSEIPSNETNDDEEKWDPGDGVPSNVVVDDGESGKESLLNDFDWDDESHPLVKWAKSDEGDISISFLDTFHSVKSFGEKCIIIQFNKYIENTYKLPMTFIYEFSKSKGIDIVKKTKEYMESKGIIEFFDEDDPVYDTE